MFDTYVNVTRVKDQGMITLRASMKDAAALGDLPAPNSVLGDMIWMSPDELMVLCADDDRDSTLKRLQAAMAQTHHLIVDVTDARAVFDLQGSAVKEVLSKLTPTDVMPLAAGDFRRTRIGQVAGAFWMVSDTQAKIICFRSVADYMDLLLKDAAKVGAEVY